MSMTCDDMLDLAMSGERDVEGRPEFIEHLRSCERCRNEVQALLDAARTIRAAPPAALAGHPASEQIVALAMDPDATSLDVHRGAAEHVSACATCTAEVEEVRRAEQKRLDSSRPARPGPAPVLGALASALTKLTSGPLPGRVALVMGLGVLALAYPAFLGLSRLPLVKGQVGDLELRTRQLEAERRDLSASLALANETASRLSHWSGPSRLLALTSPVRGRGPQQRIDIDPAEPYILVSVRPILTEPSSELDMYRFIIVGAEGQVDWRAELSAGEIRLRMKSSGALIFPIAASLLAPGRHELRVVPDKDPRQPILQIPFEIVPAR